MLQLKLGSIRPSYFKDKYGVDVRTRFSNPLTSLASAGYLTDEADDVLRLSRNGLLRIDSLLPRFFLPNHSDIRYT